jgi:hypothetical protein
MDALLTGISAVILIALVAYAVVKFVQNCAGDENAD